MEEEMTDDEHFEVHLNLCKQIYLRLKAEGKRETVGENMENKKRPTQK